MAGKSNSHIGLWIFLLVVVAIVGLILYNSLQPLEVDVLHARRGRIVESFTEPAKTRLDKTWPITMPIAGRLMRIELEPGSDVTRGDELVEFVRDPFKNAVRTST